MSLRAGFLATLLAVLVLRVASKERKKTVVLFPVPYVGFVRTHTNLGRRLLELGLRVYVLIPKYILDGKMVDVSCLEVISYGENIGNAEELTLGETIHEMWTWRKTTMNTYFNMLVAACDIVYQILSDRRLIAKLKEIKPHLILLTSSLPFKNLVILPYMLNVSFAYIGHHYDTLATRAPFAPSSMPCVGFILDPDSLVSRTRNLMCHLWVWALDYLVANDSMVDEFAPHMPFVSVIELTSKANIFIVESDHVLDFPKPEVPNVRIIGNTAAIDGEPLEEPFKSFVDSAEIGVIVVSFGSSIFQIPESIYTIMMAAFDRLNVSIIWRVNYTSPDPSMILTSKWIPQNDILAHKNTLLLISSCGVTSQYEALYHEVPILCLPIFGDQFYHAHKVATKNLGIKGNIFELTDLQILSRILKLTGKNFYYKKIRKAGRIYRTSYGDPLETAASLIHYTMTHGSSHLRPPAIDMPLYQHLSLDFIFCFGCTIVGITLLVVVSCCCCRICCKSCYRLCKRCCGRRREKID